MSAAFFISSSNIFLKCFLHRFVLKGMSEIDLFAILFWQKCSTLKEKYSYFKNHLILKIIFLLPTRFTFQKWIQEASNYLFKMICQQVWRQKLILNNFRVSLVVKAEGSWPRDRGFESSLRRPFFTHRSLGNLKLDTIYLET